jgi:hypothetical protein
MNIDALFASPAGAVVQRSHIDDVLGLIDKWDKSAFVSRIATAWCSRGVSPCRHQERGIRKRGDQDKPMEGDNG